MPPSPRKDIRITVYGLVGWRGETGEFQIDTDAIFDKKPKKKEKTTTKDNQRQMLMFCCFCNKGVQTHVLHVCSNKFKEYLCLCVRVNVCYPVKDYSYVCSHHKTMGRIVA